MHPVALEEKKIIQRDRIARSFSYYKDIDRIFLPERGGENMLQCRRNRCVSSSVSSQTIIERLRRNLGDPVYGCRAAAYAATAWGFNRPMLDRSRTIHQRAVDMRGEERGRRPDAVRKESTDRVRLYLQTKHFDGTSPRVVKKTIQALYANQPGPY